MSRRAPAPPRRRAPAPRDRSRTSPAAPSAASLFTALALACAPAVPAAAPSAPAPSTAAPPPSTWTLPAGLPLAALPGPRALVLDPAFTLLLWSPERTEALAQGVPTTDLLVAATPEALWFAWTTEQGHTTLQRAGGQPFTFTATAAECHHGGAACDVRALALTADAAGVSLGGWYGVHSDQTATRAWYVRQPHGAASEDQAVGPTPAWQSALTAMSPNASGPWLAGSVTPASTDAAPLVWLDRLGDDLPPLTLPIAHPSVPPTWTSGASGAGLIIPDDNDPTGVWWQPAPTDATPSPVQRVALPANRLPGTQIAAQTTAAGLRLAALVDADGPALAVLCAPGEPTAPAALIPLGALRPEGLADDGAGGWWVWGREQRGAQRVGVLHRFPPR